MLYKSIFDEGYGVSAGHRNFSVPLSIHMIPCVNLCGTNSIMKGYQSNQSICNIIKSCNFVPCFLFLCFFKFSSKAPLSESKHYFINSYNALVYNIPSNTISKMDDDFIETFTRVSKIADHMGESAPPLSKLYSHVHFKLLTFM